MSLGVGVVEPKVMSLKLPEGGYRLESGGLLKRIDVCYEECGAPMRDDNVIFICHALTGDAHVAGIRPGEAAAVASEHAAAAYLLGAKALFDNEPVIEFSDVEVGDGSGDSDEKGTITLSVTVKDGENPVAVASEKVQDMFEATSDLGDWDGEAKLKPTVVPLAGDGATMRFKVIPSERKTPSAFLRIRK